MARQRQIRVTGSRWVDEWGPHTAMLRSIWFELPSERRVDMVWDRQPDLRFSWVVSRRLNCALEGFSVSRVPGEARSRWWRTDLQADDVHARDMRHLPYGSLASAAIGHVVLELREWEDAARERGERSLAVQLEAFLEGRDPELVSSYRRDLEAARRAKSFVDAFRDPATARTPTKTVADREGVLPVVMGKRIDRLRPKSRAEGRSLLSEVPDGAVTGGDLTPYARRLLALAGHL